MPKGFKEFEEYDKACDEVIFEHENEPLQEAEYQGKTVKLKDPNRTSENPNKKYKVD